MDSRAHTSFPPSSGGLQTTTLVSTSISPSSPARQRWRCCGHSCSRARSLATRHAGPLSHAPPPPCSSSTRHASMQAHLRSLPHPLPSASSRRRAAGPPPCRAAARTADPPPTLSFYSILGVPPTAEPTAIRKAYHALMWDLHPDRAAASAAAGGFSPLASTSTDLCIVINDIYQVLSSAEQRAVYDSLSGFAAAPNPFLDAAAAGFPRDQVFVDELSCIGCGKCVRWAQGTFEIEASKFGRARVISQTGNTALEVQIAIETCPVDCIHYVTLPQLSLLEAVLATMARIDVAVMQRTQRSAGNVFQEAFKAFERRQAELESMIKTQEQRDKVDWGFWGTGSLEREDEEAKDAGSGSRDPAQQRIARLAVSASRAARMWQAYLQTRTARKSLAEEADRGEERGLQHSTAGE